MTDNFDGIERESGKPDFAIIWLHGLGADGNDFAALVPQLQRRGIDNVRYLFPHAPQIPVTINGGMRMRAWYDITSLDFDERAQDRTGTEQSQQLVERLVQREIERGIPVSRIVLAGFSQGGAIALHTALRHAAPLAGIMALSTYLPLSASVEQERNAINSDISIFMAHGTLDEVIDQRYAEASRDKLQQLGYQVDWHSYPMPHSLSADEIDDIASWLHGLMQKQ